MEYPNFTPPYSAGGRTPVTGLRVSYSPPETNVWIKPCTHPIGDSGSGGGRGEGRKEGKEGSLGWGVQALFPL